MLGLWGWGGRRGGGIIRGSEGCVAWRSEEGSGRGDVSHFLVDINCILELAFSFGS